MAELAPDKESVWKFGKQVTYVGLASILRCIWFDTYDPLWSLALACLLHWITYDPLWSLALACLLWSLALDNI
jgi:hypothetical protein